MMWYAEPGWNWTGLITMVLAMILFWSGLVAVVVLVLRHFKSGIPPHRDAENVLAVRFARGEIDETEYARLRNILHTN